MGSWTFVLPSPLQVPQWTCIADCGGVMLLADKGCVRSLMLQGITIVSAIDLKTKSSRLHLPIRLIRLWLWAF